MSPTDSPGDSHKVVHYRLEQLYDDHHVDFVVDAIAHAVAWLETHASPQPVEIRVSLTSEISEITTVNLTWDLAALEAFDPQLQPRIQRILAGRTPQREHTTELAGYALGLVAMAIFLPEEEVMDYRKGLAPDIVYDLTDGAIRGVEVAARSGGSWGTLKSIRLGTPKMKSARRRSGKKPPPKRKRKRNPGKAKGLRDASDVAEAYLSLWSGKYCIAEFVKVKP